MLAITCYYFHKLDSFRSCSATRSCYCGTSEDVDIKDSNKNTSPFICSGCYTIENRENASEDTTTKIEVITSVYICSEPIVEISIVTWGAIQPG